jgi:hypothetical protein
MAFTVAMVICGVPACAEGSDIDSWTGVGIGVGSPYGISARVWGNIGRAQTGDGDPWGGASRLGVVWELQTGTGGGKIALGYGAGGLGTLTLKGVATRTWFHPWWADKNATYLGGELEIGVLFYALSFGKLWRLGDAGDRRSVFAIQFVLQIPPGALH